MAPRARASRTVPQLDSGIMTALGDLTVSGGMALGRDALTGSLRERRHGASRREGERRGGSVPADRLHWASEGLDVPFRDRLREELAEAMAQFPRRRAGR